MPVFPPNELSELVMTLAFAIEDPCGLEAIELARALIDLGRAIPEKRRKGFAALCRSAARSFEPVPEPMSKD